MKLTTGKDMLWSRALTWTAVDYPVGKPRIERMLDGFKVILPRLIIRYRSKVR